jgi:hypothetical protein
MQDAIAGYRVRPLPRFRMSTTRHKRVTQSTGTLKSLRELPAMAENDRTLARPARGPRACWPKQGAEIMQANASVWVGRAMSALFVLFILGASAAPKLMGMPIAEQVMSELGWPLGYVLPIGILELTLVLLYAWPRTRVLGAVLFMGLLGGAMATQIRAGTPLFSHQLFSVYLGLFMWGGLWLRDGTLRDLFPWQRNRGPRDRPAGKDVTG